MAFARAARKQDVPPGKIYEFQVAGQAVAIANVAGKFFAINSVCAHEGGPLGEGELWQYDVTTGKVAQNPAIGVDAYPVEVRGEDVFVDVGS
jgi:nitrite reductase/ring-hydroxylating ferredoxin subunit